MTSQSPEQGESRGRMPEEGRYPEILEMGNEEAILNLVVVNVIFVFIFMQILTRLTLKTILRIQLS